LQLPGLPLFASFKQERDKSFVWCEMVLYGLFVSANHEAEFSKADSVELFKNNLEERLQTRLLVVSEGENGKQLLRHLLCNGQQSRSQTSH
jgi:hypothetical protein